MRKYLLFLVLTIFLFLAISTDVKAGFGVSPPYISSDKIRPGLRFEQTIRLLRSTAEESLEVELEIDAPEFVGWLSLEGGKKIVMPVGSFSVPVRVIIDVPTTAALGNYQGKIVFKTKPLSDSGNLISFSTGAEINISFDLTDDLYNELKIQNASLSDYKLGTDLFSKLPLVKYFRPLKLDLKIENKGNIDNGPDNIVIDIYDITERNLLQSLSDKKLKKIKPFDIVDMTATFPLDLEVGQYWANIRVYNEDKIIYSFKSAFSVVSTKEYRFSTLVTVLTSFLLTSLFIYLAWYLFRKYLRAKS